jgi:hypothetical protein
MNIREWLQQEPDVADLIEINGAFTHPYEAIVRKLYVLCPDGWDTQNFKHQFYTLPDGRVKVSGSIEVVVEYEIEVSQKVWDPACGEAMGLVVRKIRRVLSGAATFSTTDYCSETETNEHFAATVKSLAIVNAVQVLGKQFGWGLNSGTLPTEQLKGESPLSKFQKKVLAAVKVAPDAATKEQWNEAVEKNNIKKLKLFNAMYTITPGEDGFHFVKIEE